MYLFFFLLWTLLFFSEIRNEIVFLSVDNLHTYSYREYHFVYVEQISFESRFKLTYKQFISTKLQFHKDEEKKSKFSTVKTTPKFFGEKKKLKHFLTVKTCCTFVVLDGKTNKLYRQ